MKKQCLLGVYLLLSGSLSSVALAGEAPMPVVDYLTRFTGQKVTLYGQLTDEVHQHMVQPPGPDHQIAYLKPDIGGQLVVYLPKKTPPCLGPLKLQGRVLELRGPSKRPGGPPSKVDETYVEHQLQVESSLCLSAQGLEADLRLLGLAQTAVAHKEAARERLFQAGKTAIPHLIAHLDDQRVYHQSPLLPPLNAPATAAQPPLAQRETPVSNVVRELLYRIITPVYSSPYATRGKVYSTSVFGIKDWERWWQKHQHQSLAQIHKELRPRVDAYWQGKGRTQYLD